MMRFFKLQAVVLTAIWLLGACASTSAERITLQPDSRWALLPIINLSTTPLAGQGALSLVESELFARGVQNVSVYPHANSQDLLDYLNEYASLADAKVWATEKGATYALTGEIQEWRYKNGLDSEPAVSMTLKIIDLRTDEVVWLNTGSRVGWGYSSVTKIASKTIHELLAKVDM